MDPARENEIERILTSRLNGPYKILNIPQTASSEEIRRALRKSILLVHPDKNNSSPKANEAAKILNEANEQLTKSPDADDTHEDISRNYFYTPYAEEDRNAEAHQNANAHGNAGGHPNADARPRANDRPRPNANARPNANRPPNIRENLTMGGIVICLFVFGLAWLYYYQPLYSMEKTLHFPYIQTTKLGVTYYVNSDYSKLTYKSQRKIENLVEETYFSKWKSPCEEEIDMRETLLLKARTFQDRTFLMEAHFMKMPSCLEFDRLKQKSSLYN